MASTDKSDKSQDFLSLYLDNIQDVYEKLCEYTDKHCVPLMDQSDIVDFVDFCEKNHKPQETKTQTKVLEDTTVSDEWTTV